MEFDIKIGDNIKRIRKEKGLKQKELAERLNMPISTLANYENNKREPDFATLKAIANELGTLEVFLLDNSKQIGLDFMVGSSYEDLKTFISSEDETTQQIGQYTAALISNMSNTIGSWGDYNDNFNSAILNIIDKLINITDIPPRIHKNVDISALSASLNEIANFIEYQCSKIYKDER